jgi:hypothetical protein
LVDEEAAPMSAPCPRCDDRNTQKAADSPVPSAWTVTRCTRCNYVWRSTETLSGIHRYDQSLVDRVTPWWPQIKRRDR